MCVLLFPVNLAGSLTELLWAFHLRPQGSGDQSLQDGGGRTRRRGKPHFLQNLRPDRRGEGWVDEQHQVSPSFYPPCPPTEELHEASYLTVLHPPPAGPPSAKTRSTRCWLLGRRRSRLWRVCRAGRGLNGNGPDSALVTFGPDGGFSA